MTLSASVRWSLAVAALASLPWLWLHRPGGPADEAARGLELRALERLAALGRDPLPGLDDFIARHGSTSDAPYARLLRARARLDALDRVLDVHADELQAAWTDLAAAPAEMAVAVKLRAARLALLSGHRLLADGWFRGLGRDAAPDHALALAAAGRAPEALELGPTDPFVSARVHLALRDFAAALRALEGRSEPRALALRARIRLAAGEFARAAEDARQAQSALPESDDRDEALYVEAEARRALRDPGAETAAAILLRGRSRWRPYGHLALGRWLLDRGSPDAVVHLQAWSEALASPRDLAFAGLEAGPLEAFLLDAAWAADDEAADAWIGVLGYGRWRSQRSADRREVLLSAEYMARLGVLRGPGAVFERLETLAAGSDVVALRARRRLAEWKSRLGDATGAESEARRVLESTDPAGRGERRRTLALLFRLRPDQAPGLAGRIEALAEPGAEAELAGLHLDAHARGVPGELLRARQALGPASDAPVQLRLAALLGPQGLDLYRAVADRSRDPHDRLEGRLGVARLAGGVDLAAARRDLEDLPPSLRRDVLAALLREAEGVAR